MNATAGVRSLVTLPFRRLVEPHPKLISIEHSHITCSRSIPSPHHADVASGESLGLLLLPGAYLAKLVTKVVHPSGGVVSHDCKFCGDSVVVLGSHLHVISNDRSPKLNRQQTDQAQDRHDQQALHE
jgi:hypothetical protein